MTNLKNIHWKLERNKWESYNPDWEPIKQNDAFTIYYDGLGNYILFKHLESKQIFLTAFEFDQLRTLF